MLRLTAGKAGTRAYYRVAIASTSTTTGTTTRTKTLRAVKVGATASGVARGKRSVRAGRTFKDTVRLSHTGTLQRKVGLTWRAVAKVPAGRSVVRIKAGRAGTAASYRIVVRSTSQSVGVTTRTLTVRAR